MRVHQGEVANCASTQPVGGGRDECAGSHRRRRGPVLRPARAGCLARSGTARDPPGQLGGGTSVPPAVSQYPLTAAARPEAPTGGWAALGVTAYSQAPQWSPGQEARTGRRRARRGRDRPVSLDLAAVAKTQRQLNVCQWLVPALTAGLEALNALHGQQQRPAEQASGILAKPAQLINALT